MVCLLSMGIVHWGSTAPLTVELKLNCTGWPRDLAPRAASRAARRMLAASASFVRTHPPFPQAVVGRLYERHSYYGDRVRAIIIKRLHFTSSYFVSSVPPFRGWAIWESTMWQARNGDMLVSLYLVIYHNFVTCLFAVTLSCVYVERSQQQYLKCPPPPPPPPPPHTGTYFHIDKSPNCSP